MTTESDALPEGPVVERNAGGSGPLSVREAARSLADTRYKEQAEAGRQVEAAKEAPKVEEPKEPAVQESAPEADAGAAETPPTSETQEVEAVEEALPPIEPPKSWTKEEKERFQSLPRETQEFIANRESERDRSYSQRQREAAEKAKALEAKEQAAEQVRQQYEQALPMLLQALQEGHQGEFADIKSIADIERLAREDWPRYVLWDAQQKKIAAVQQQVQAARERETQEKSTKLKTFIADENAKFLEKAPELADAKVMTKVQQGAVEMLKDLGFEGDELGQLWRGEKEISLHDHRLQLLLRDGVRYREAQASMKAVKAAPKPPVQRPGTAPSKSSGLESQIQAIEKQLSAATGLAQIRLGAQLRTLRMQAAQTR